MPGEVGDNIDGLLLIALVGSMESEDFLFLLLVSSLSFCWNTTAVGVSGDNQDEGVVEPALPVLATGGRG